jgi:hypothetical protein
MCAMYDNMAGVWVCMNLLCVCVVVRERRERWVVEEITRERERKENHDDLKKREYFSKLVVEIGEKKILL